MDLAHNAQGYLDFVANIDAAPMAWRIVKVYTMPDGQEAVKVQRIK